MSSHLDAIDAHHHLWNFSEREYGWIGEEMGILRRDFLVSDFSETISSTDVSRSVVVQARQTIEETEWLLGLAAEKGPIAGVVGWVALQSATVRQDLRRLSHHPSLVGVRHVVHDEPDDNFILGRAFNAGVAMLKEFDLAYDILIKEHHLPQTIEFVSRHPEQRFVVDHVAKPRIHEGAFDSWAEGMRELGRRENVYCKLSGMVTEADWTTWSVDTLQRYADHVLETFGPNRTMFGSDWPVCLVASDYPTWRATADKLASSLSENERYRVFRDTAIEAYRLEEV